MKYIIDEEKLYKLIDAEVSFVADQAHDKDGNDLFDGIVLTSKDGDWVKRFMHDAAARLVGRMPDIAKFSAYGTKSDAPTSEAGASTSTDSGIAPTANGKILSAPLKAKGETDGGSSSTSTTDPIINLPDQYVGDSVTCINLIHIARRTNLPYLVGRDSVERFTATKTGVKYRELDLDPDGLRVEYEEYLFTLEDPEAAKFYNNAIYAGRRQFGGSARNPMVTINYWGVKGNGDLLPWSAIVYITEDNISGIETDKDTLSFKGVIYRGLTGVEDSQYWITEGYVDGDGNLIQGRAGSSLFVNTGASVLVYRVFTEMRPGDYTDVSTGVIEHGSLNLGGMEVFSQMSTDDISMQLSPTKVTFGATFADPKSVDKYVTVRVEKALTADASATLSWNYKTDGIPSWFTVAASGTQLIIKLAEANESTTQRSALVPVVANYQLPDGRASQVVQYITVVQEPAQEEVKPDIAVSVQPDKLFYDAEPQASQHVTVSIGDGSDYRYVIRYDDEEGETGWINVSKNGSLLTVWCRSNKEPEARTGYIDIIPLEGDGTPKTTIEITQAGADQPEEKKLELSVTPTTLKLDYDDMLGLAYYKATPGAQVSIELDDSWPSWIIAASIPEDAPGVYGNEINVELEHNESSDAREADIVVKAVLPSVNPANPPQVATQILHIYQKGNNDDELIPDEPDSEGLSITFHDWSEKIVNAMAPVRLSELPVKEVSESVADWEPWTNAEWLHVNRDTDAGQASIWAEADPNPSQEMRKAEVFVTAYNAARTKSATISVGFITQDLCPLVEINPSSIMFEAVPQGAQEVSCVVKGSVKLNAGATFASAALVTGDKLRVSLDANTGKARGCTISVTASNMSGESVTKNLTVNQRSGASYSGGGNSGSSSGGDSGGGDDDGDTDVIGTNYIKEAIDITAPDFDENIIKYENSNSSAPWNKDGVWNIITRYIVLFSCMRIFEDRYTLLAPTYLERTQAAMDNIVNIVRQRKAPSRTVA